MTDRINGFKLHIELDVFCANDVPPSPYMVARYIRESMPTIIMKGDLDSMDRRRVKMEYYRLLETDGEDAAFSLNPAKMDGWDEYSIHLRPKVSVIST